jgi:hypothetical protein
LAAEHVSPQGMEEKENAPWFARKGWEIYAAP